MADGNRFRAREPAPCRRQELEDVPMSRQGVRVEATRTGGACRAGDLAALLVEQNRLLYDILGALTSLTAAQLAAGQNHRA